MPPATVVRQLQLRSGLKADLPNLSPLILEGELYYCTDTKELFMGTTGNAYTKMDIQYSPATPSNWAGSPPDNLIDAMNRAAALLVTLNGGPIP